MGPLMGPGVIVPPCHLPLGGPDWGRRPLNQHSANIHTLLGKIDLNCRVNSVENDERYNRARAGQKVTKTEMKTRSIRPSVFIWAFKG